MSSLLTRALRSVNWWTAWIAGALLMLLLAVVLATIVARFIFNYSLKWSFDLTSYGLLFLVFLSAAYTLEHDGHIRLDFVLVRLPRRARLVVEIGAEALSAVFAALLLWATARETLLAIQGDWTAPSSYAIPLKYVYWIMPFGSALLLLTALLRLLATLTHWRQRWTT
jgi:TRAP-type C4-dicarboxylate transport system permease small subunit